MPISTLLALINKIIYMKKKIFIPLSVVAVLAIIVVGCNKNKPYDTIVAPAQAHFLSSSKYVSYYVSSAANDSFSIGVGTTDISNADRTTTFNVSSNTAVAGTQYSILSPSSGNSITIPKGKATSSIVIHGNFAQYPANKKDTLRFTLAQPSIDVAKFNDTLNVILQRYCNVNASTFTGNYNNCYDIDPSGTYGPYTANVVSVTPLTATTASMVIANFSFAEVDPYPISNITVTLDWTDPGNFKVTIPAQILSNSNFYGYGPLTVTGVGVSTFSSCDNTFTLNYKLTVSAGSFGNFTTTIAR